MDGAGWAVASSHPLGQRPSAGSVSLEVAIAMETMRLRKIQVPTSLEQLLDALITRAKLVPEDSYRIRDPKSLPILLQNLVKRAMPDGKVWSAWSNGPRTWLFTSEMSFPRSRELGTPVLQTAIYGEDGQLKESAAWTSDRTGSWNRCAD
jgi:hypothetical protein